MAIEVTDQQGFVVLPPKLRYTQDGRSYIELVVDFGSKKPDHWYVRVWKEHLFTSVMRTAVKDALVVVSGSMSKWQHLGGGYSVALNAETLEVKPSNS